MPNRVGILCGDFEAFDRDWQAISYKLRRIPELNQSAAIQRVDTIDKIDHALSDIFKIKPHFDQRELLRATAALTDKLQRLAEDIGVEMVDPQMRRSLIGMARRTQSEAQMVSDMVDSENDPAAVAGEFKEYLELWHPLARQIRQVDANRALERTVFRISQSNREIAEFLRMPAQTDTTNVGYIMDSLKRDMDEYFTRAPLRLVMELPDARDGAGHGGRILRAVRTVLAGARATTPRRPNWPTRSIMSRQSWRAFNHTFRPMNSEPARRVLNRIEEGMGSLAQALQINDQQFDGRRISELAYALVGRRGQHQPRHANLARARSPGLRGRSAPRDAGVRAALPAVQRCGHRRRDGRTAAAGNREPVRALQAGLRRSFRSAAAASAAAWPRTPNEPRRPWSICARS